MRDKSPDNEKHRKKLRHVRLAAWAGLEKAKLTVYGWIRLAVYNRPQAGVDMISGLVLQSYYSRSSTSEMRVRLHWEVERRRETGPHRVYRYVCASTTGSDTLSAAAGEEANANLRVDAHTLLLPGLCSERIHD